MWGWTKSGKVRSEDKGVGNRAAFRLRFGDEAAPLLQGPGGGAPLTGASATRVRGTSENPPAPALISNSLGLKWSLCKGAVFGGGVF